LENTYVAVLPAELHSQGLLVNEKSFDILALYKSDYYYYYYYYEVLCPSFYSNLSSTTSHATTST